METTSSWPKTYHETHVLLLGWSEEFDDTETTNEVSREELSLVLLN